MGSHGTKSTEPVEELPDDWWYKVYAGVVAVTIVVITALWFFSWYFSK